MNRSITSAATLCVLAAGLLVACDDETINLGVPSDNDLVQTSSEVFHFTTRSVGLDSVIANSAKSYFGEVQDPETGTDVKAEFLTQFYTFEDYSLPKEENIIKSENGDFEADSVEIRLYFTDFYGDAVNPMKLQVFELDTANVIAEGQTCYANTDLTQYLRPGAEPLTTKSFTPLDYSLTAQERNSVSHYNNVRINLPRRIGTEILQKAVRHPRYFANSWQFIHHVCPGFYFKLVSGKGTMLTVDVATLNVYFRYRDHATDSVVVGLSRFSATPEVIQNTSFQHQGIEKLLAQTDVPYTYLKSPAALATELALPVDDIYAGHESDSISRARIILTRLNSQRQDTEALGVPSTVLLVTKQRQRSFFSERCVADNETAYTANFDPSLNTYTFANVSRLIAYMHRAKQRGMALQGLTSQQWNEHYPDWNRVLVIPVAVTTTQDSSTGATKQVAVNHDFSLSTARIVGGTQPIQMQVIYSRY